MRPLSPLPLSLLLAASCLGFAGCGAVRAPIETFVTGDGGQEERMQLTEEHRERFRKEADPESVRWLLTNVVEQGMTLEDVGGTLGMPGERLYDVPWKNSGGTRFQVTDEVYQWGPDSDGHAYPLVFRDGKLVNYDRNDYR